MFSRQIKCCCFYLQSFYVRFKIAGFQHSLIINLWNSKVFENPTSVITLLLMLLVVLSLSGSRSVCWSSSTWRGTEGDGGIGGMPTHFATDDDDGKHGARRARPSWLQLTSYVGDYYVHTYYENRLEEEEICSSTFCC